MLPYKWVPRGSAGKPGNQDFKHERPMRHPWRDARVRVTGVRKRFRAPVSSVCLRSFLESGAGEEKGGREGVQVVKSNA